ncbi:MAG: ABC transporter permease [Rubrobacteraceae bacterium]
MGAVRPELLKLKRSLSWAVVVGLPVAMVLAGAVNTTVAGGQPEDGWHTMWLQSVVFYGLFPLALGIGVLASLVWRVEHRGGNWNAIMGGPTPSLRIVTAKAVVLAVLAAAMQAVFLIATVVIGKLVFGLPGMLPGKYLAISILIVLACIPVAALQSGLSMLMRSFAAPIAVAFVGAGVSVVLLLAGLNAAIFVIPYALIGQATQLGTGFPADTGATTPGDVASITIAAVILTVVLTVGTAAILDHRDTRT